MRKHGCNCPAKIVTGENDAMVEYFFNCLNSNKASIA